MTGRERFLGAIERTPIDRIPRYDGFWEETLNEYGKTPQELAQEFEYDAVMFALDSSMRFPTRRIDLGTQEEGWDRYGFHMKRNKGRSTLHYLDFATAAPEDWEKYRHRFTVDKTGESRVDTDAFFLRTAPAPSWQEAVDRINASGGDKFRFINFYGPWEGTWRHHGFENTLMDMICEPNMMEDMFDLYTDTALGALDYALELGMQVDAVWLVEDLGSTRAPLFSPDLYRRLLKPRHARIMDFAHAHGLKVVMHSCGEVSAFIPDLIDVGLDVLEALQANTTLHVARLKAQYGSRLSFMGNISVQKMAEGGSAIRREMEEKIIPAMQGGGYIYHSVHSIPPEVTYDKYCDVMRILDEIGKY